MEYSAYGQRDVKYNYLKYYSVVKYYFQRRYKLTNYEFNMLLFLYSEQYFTYARFDEYENVMPWDRKRFKKLVERGFIEVFREDNPQTKQKAIYQLAYKSKRFITNLYNILNNETLEISTNKSQHKIFLKKVRYTDKVMRNFIKKINKERRQLRHRLRE
jgi:hypothetical protein